MPLYAAGQKIRGSEINALPQVYRTSVDQQKIDATLSNAIGLSFPAEINGWYLVECFLFYKAALTRDIKLQWSYPAGTSGWWGADGIESGAAGGSVGQVNRQSLPLIQPHAFNGSDAIDVFAAPVSTIQVGSTAGTVQLQYAQYSADGANPTIVRAGSAIRVSRLA